MNISELVTELQTIQDKHGDLHVAGVVPYGNPEMTIHAIIYQPEGHDRHESRDRAPERVLIEWKYTG